MPYYPDAPTNDDETISAAPTPGFRRILVAVVLICLGLLLLTSFSFVSFDHLVGRTFIRLEAVSTLLLETTEGHLWFEELLSGDQNEDIRMVWLHLDKAEHCAQALLNGGDIEAGEVEALTEPSFHHQMEEIIKIQTELRRLAEDRYEHAVGSEAGTLVDQQFDRVFEQFTINARVLESGLRQNTRHELFNAKLLHLALVFCYVILAVALLSVLYRYEKNQVAATALLLKRDTQLRQAQKMEAVGNLAGGIAHDFNNLLQAIIGYGEVLADDLAEAGRSTEEINTILNAGRRAADLTRQLLAYSRRQVITPVDINLNDLIANLMKMIQRLIGENITLELALGQSPVMVHADRTQMEQILMNLCINARDAITNTGRITIESEAVVIDDTYRADHPWAHPGSYALLTVTDTGGGMEQNIIDQVFEPFFTTKAVGKGTGLGLSTVYGIVKQNSGMVNVYSEVDHGSTFKIYWPLIEGAAGSQAPAKVTRPIGGDETILVAEDDPGVLGFVTKLLEKNGYRVLSARDGQEAINIFNSAQDIIDLALLDVIMPIKGGREVMDHIRQSGSNIPVVFSSGYSMNAIHTDFVLDDGIILLEKPYRRHELLVQLRKALQAAQ